MQHTGFLKVEHPLRQLSFRAEIVLYSQAKIERERERKKDTGTQVSDGKGCIISRNAGLYIFSKMIAQLLHRMKFYQ